MNSYALSLILFLDQTIDDINHTETDITVTDLLGSWISPFSYVKHLTKAWYSCTRGSKSSCFLA